MATVTSTAFVTRGADGGPLRGDVRTAAGGRDRPAVIICHGFKGFKDWGFFPQIAARLARAGMTTVSFNFGGSGVGPDGETFSEPERFARATFSNDIRDLTAVAGLLREGRLIDGMAAPTRLGVFGHSRGGGTATLFSGGASAVDALVTWAAIATVRRWPAEIIDRWKRDGSTDVVNARTGEVLPLYTDILDDIEKNPRRLDITRAASEVRCPWLIVHGGEDETVSAEEGRLLFAAAPSDRTSLVVVEGAGHTFGARHPWAGTTPEFDRAMDVTVDWFATHLL